MLIKSVKIAAFFCILFGGLFSLHAQPAAVQQFQNNQLSQPQQTILTNLTVGHAAPELYQGENADVGPQRILRLNPRPLYFGVLLDSQGFYTDNANYAQDDRQLGVCEHAASHPYATRVAAWRRKNFRQYRRGQPMV
jgi:hypothetical protein